jgi:hypothetical protein
MIHVVTVDASANPTLTGPVAQCIRDYARVHGGVQADPDLATREIMSHLWQGAAHLLVLALVEETGAVVGHLVAVYGENGTRRSVVIQQVKATANVGDGIDRAAALVETWAKSKGAAHTLLVSHRDPEKSGPKKWREMGYEPTHTILVKSLNGAGPAHG